MKKIVKCILGVFMILSVICGVNLICTQDVSAEETTIRWVNGVPYDANGRVIIRQGDEIGLIATTARADPIFVSGGWNSDKSSVARVTEQKMYVCIVRGVSTGTCVISYDGSTAYRMWDSLIGGYQQMVNKQHEEFKIRVVKRADVVTLNAASLTVRPNGTAKLSYALSPVDEYTAALTTVTYSSSDPTVATVDANGNITGIKNGTADITVKTDTGVTATCKVTVSTSSSANNTSKPDKINGNKAPTGIALDRTSLNLQKGKSKTLKYVLTPRKAKSSVKWNSSNKKVATVNSSGKVTAKSCGKAVITATTANGKTATCKVKVSAPKPKKIKLNKTSLKLTAGKSATLKYTLSPKGSAAKVSFKSSKTSVATVSAKGKVTAKKAGKATITVKTSNGKKATCKVTVKNPAVKKIKLNQKTLSLKVGDKYRMTYTLSPKNAAGKIKWSSSRKNVATVNSSGEITAKASGKTTVTAKYSSKIYAKCTVTVTKKDSNPAGGNSSSANASDGTSSPDENNSQNPVIPASAISVSGASPYMMVGESMNLGAVLSPANTTDSVIWTSGDKSVASVSSEGVVKGLKEGGVTITAWAGKMKASVNIAVVSGDVYDISKGEISVLAGDYPHNRKVEYNGNTYEYDTSRGVTIVQSDPLKSNFITVGGGKVTFANVHLSNRSIHVWDYHTSDDDPYVGDITLEFMDGTENSLSDGNAPIQYTKTSKGTNTLVIQGKASVELTSGYGPALMGSRITIKDVTMTARVQTDTCGVIGTYEGVDCSDITILPGAKITAYGGYVAVGAGQNGASTNISVAPGTVTHIR